MLSLTALPRFNSSVPICSDELLRIDNCCIPVVPSFQKWSTIIFKYFQSIFLFSLIFKQCGQSHDYDDGVNFSEKVFDISEDDWTILLTHANTTSEWNRPSRASVLRNSEVTISVQDNFVYWVSLRIRMSGFAYAIISIDDITICYPFFQIYVHRWNRILSSLDVAARFEFRRETVTIRNPLRTISRYW